MIKSGGEWISSVELECAIAAHPGVAEATVISVPDPRWEERPLACIVAKPGQKLKPDELREWLRDKVAKFWLPERWTFIAEVPKTSVGKFDKKQLRAQYAEGKLEIISLGPAPGAR
jgi:fatty-acyl-CoA synthase